MEVFKYSSWIWPQNASGNDTHVEFLSNLEWNGGKAICNLSCDSDYQLYVNGKFVQSNQYLSFDHYKAYDEIDVTPYLNKGNNVIAIHVWYFGVPSQRYQTASAGLIFEVTVDGTVALSSSSKVLGRKSLVYESGMCKMITVQLGLTFKYDATKEDGWINGQANGFAPCVEIVKPCTFCTRPKEKLVFGERQPITVVSASDDGKHYVIDLGRECVGIPCLELISTIDKNLVTVSYGEILVDGHVKRIIATRDFSFEYIAKKGTNSFVHNCLRLGLRYLEIDCDAPISLEYAGVINQYYPVKERPVIINGDFEREMYDLSVRSLHLCMMEHYVDCPWREQNFYAFDSRNQMLFGYYAFEGGNSEFVRSNLMLMAKAPLINGIFPICSPSGTMLTIPSFALYFYLAVKEYIKYTGDNTIAAEVLPALNSVIEVFLSNKKDGLIYKFPGAENWNFYDWSPCSDGTLGRPDVVAPDAMINILTIMALNCLKEITAAAGQAFAYEGIADELALNTKKTFFNSEDGLFTMNAGKKDYTELVNCQAVINGLTTKEETAIIAQKLVNGDLIPAALSMKVFRYDTLLLADEAKYSQYILDDMRRDFKVMLDNGATATWETIDGAVAFDDAGSLCHGWTALPVYYFNRLGVIVK